MKKWLAMTMFCANLVSTGLQAQNAVSSSDTTKKRIALKNTIQQTSELFRLEDPNVDNLHAWRYTILQSALPIKNKLAFYQNYNLAANDFYFGLNNDFSVGVGYALPYFAYVNPKFSFALNKIPRRYGHAIAVSNMSVIGFFTGLDHRTWANNMQLLYTLGNDYRNFTVGLGTTSSSELDGASLITSLGGLWAVNADFYISGELWANSRTRDVKGIYLPFEQDLNGNWVEGTNVNIARKLNRKTLYTAIQFRLLGQKNRANAWSFGVSSYWESGDVVEENYTGAAGTEKVFTVGPKNRFIFIPSFTYTRCLNANR